MKPRLRIAGSGMCCAVGLHARAARAAIRAGLDHFEVSEFVNERGDPITVSRLPLGDVWGARRLAEMVASVAREATQNVAGIDPKTTALLLLVAEQKRPGYNPAWAAACAAAAEPFASQSKRVLPFGRAGITFAMREAHAMITRGDARHVLIAGADSYLNAHGVTHLLKRDRILGTGGRDGFVPSEGAGAVVVELEGEARAGLHVLGAGDAEETALIDNDEVVRGNGLTRAVKGALEQSGYRLKDLDFRMTDMTGEQLFFRETALATTRLMEKRDGVFPLLHITDNVGETGAAVGPLSLAYLTDTMARGLAPGRRAIAHFANDGPMRSALVLEHLTP